MNENELIINAVGDISLAPHPLSYHSGVDYFIKKYNIEAVFRNIENIFQRDSLNFGNLECTLSSYSDFKDVRKYFLRGKPEYAKFLIDSGFNLLNIVNNHSLDHGKTALKEMVSTLEKYGITILKYHDYQKQSLYPLILEVNGYKIGFLSFCLNLGTLKCVIKPPSKIEIINNIKKNKKILDFIIVSLHWGYEYTYYPSLEQIGFAHDLIDAGVDVILGHHPHVLQPIERYNKKLIFYSLGNFIFDFNIDDGVSAVFHLNLQNLEKVYYTPIKIDKYGNPKKISGKKILRVYPSKKLLDEVPMEYETYFQKRMKIAKKMMIRTAIKNSYKYGLSWYEWFIKKRIGGNKT